MNPMKILHLLPLLALASSLAFAQTGVSQPGMLGTALREVTPSDVKEQNLPGEWGAVVEAVAPGGPAEKAGLQPGDVIVTFNGQQVTGARTMRRLVYESPAGRTVELRIVRDGEATLVHPTLGEGQAPAMMGQTQAPPPRSLGVWIEPLAPAVAQYLELDEGVGMIVREVKPESAADRAGIKPKDVIVAVGDSPVTSGEMVAEHIRGLSGYSTLVTVVRGGERKSLDVSF